MKCIDEGGTAQPSTRAGDRWSPSVRQCSHEDTVSLTHSLTHHLLCLAVSACRETGAPYKPFQPPTPPNGSFVDGMLNRSIAAGSVFVNPVNVLGWVVKSRDSCYSFPVSQYGPQQQQKGDAGNGILTNGTFLTSDWHCFERYDIAANVEWLRHLDSLFGAEKLGQHLIIQTADNEPDCFNPVHRDVHPNMFGFDELWETTLQFGTMMRSLYPHVHLNGPSWSNWCWYWWVRGDGCGGLAGQDFRQHGSVFTNPYLMQKINDYYLATGVKLLDSLDVHYYPESIPNSDDTPAQQQQYLDEVRSLWDPSYNDPGSIGRCGVHCLGPAVTLLPRLRETVSYAPDLNISYSVSEYAWGFNDDVYTAALCVAEVMAVMGQWNALLSARWVSPGPGTKAEQAYKVYLNYDGMLGKVAGDSVKTVSSTSPQQTAYTVYNATAERLFILFFNRDLDAKGNSSATIAVNNAILMTGSNASAAAAVYTITPSQWQLTRQADIPIVATSHDSAAALTLSLQQVEPRSLLLLVAEGVGLMQGVEASWWEPEVGPGYLSLEEMKKKMAEEGPMNDDELSRQLQQMGDTVRDTKYGKVRPATITKRGEPTRPAVAF